MALYNIENLRCSYERPYTEGRSRVVLEIKKLEISRGEKIFIVGESGIGKSTILETLGMMNNTIVPDLNTRFVFQTSDMREVDLKALWYADDAVFVGHYREAALALAITSRPMRMLHTLVCYKAIHGKKLSNARVKYWLILGWNI